MISSLEVPGGNLNLKINSKAQQKTRLIVIIITGPHCLKIRTQIPKLCSSAFPYLSIRFVFRPCLRLANFFPFTYRVPKSLRSRVVYRFKRQLCSSLYLGQTSGLLHKRISDHLGISALDGKKRVNPPPTTILPHHCEIRHPVSPQ